MSKEEPLVVSDEQLIRLLKDANKKLGDLARLLTEQLSASQKREVILRDALENAKDALWNYGVTKHAENAEKALAATADLDGVILCHAEPAITSGKYPLYRAWEPK